MIYGSFLGKINLLTRSMAIKQTSQLSSPVIKWLESNFQAFVPIISSPLFGMIYRGTVEALPQTYLIVIAGLFFINWCVRLLCRVVSRDGPTLTPGIQDPDLFGILGSSRWDPDLFA